MSLVDFADHRIGVSGSSILRNQSPEIVTGVEETLDRISDLPESLLVQILSLLPTTQDAFRTCVVSKRWHYLWTLLDKLIFAHRVNLNSDDLMSFVDFVVLSRYSSSKIKILEFDFGYHSKYDTQITRCLSLAVEAKVEDVGLNLYSVGDIYTLPQSICNCSSLITLSLMYCGFDNKGFGIEWKFLKSIYMYSVVLDDEVIVNLLSGCPALETMELDDFYGLRRLEIKSSNLKRLRLRRFGLDDGNIEHVLIIVAPYLEHLEISGNHALLKCNLSNISSLISASLTFYMRCMDYVGGIYDGDGESCRFHHRISLIFVRDNLQKLSRATELTIGPWFAEMLSMLQLEGLQLVKVPLPEFKCKCLRLSLHLSKYNMYGVASLLQASPHVETLIIDTGATIDFFRFRCNFELRYLDRGDDIDLQGWIPNFVFPNLKNVKIVSTFALCMMEQFEEGFDMLFRLSEFLLKRAMALEKFVILRKCRRCSENCVSLFLSLLAEKLLGCPRSSANVVISYHESVVPS